MRYDDEVTEWECGASTRNVIMNVTVRGNILIISVKKSETRASLISGQNGRCSSIAYFK